MLRTFSKMLKPLLGASLVNCVDNELSVWRNSEEFGCVVQEELRSLKEGEVRERTPARPPQRSFGPRRFGQALFGQRAGGRDGPLLPSVPPRSYGKVPPMPSGPPGSPGGAGSVLQQVLTAPSHTCPL